MTASLAFGELRTGTWGVGRSDHDGEMTVAVGGAGQTAAFACRLEPGPPGVAWHLAADELELTLSPTGPELYTADGHFILAGDRHEVNAGAWARLVDEPAADWSSLRQVTTWFSEQDGIVLVAARPAAAGSHAEDETTATLLGTELATGEHTQVEDPRLSTTYDGDGGVIRAGIELWLGAPESEELHVLRASGEAASPAARWDAGGASFAARLFRWHGRGHQAPGVYLLGRRAAR